MSLEFQSEIYKSGILTTIEVHDHDYDIVEFVIKRNMLSEDCKTLVDSKNSMYFTNREFKDFFSQFREWLLGLLRDENTKDLLVTFTKKDGSQRVINATLAQGRIPTDKQPKSQAEDSYSSAACRVFDTELGEWRSFRWDSIVKVKADI
jgi:hypothetical protein